MQNVILRTTNNQKWTKSKYAATKTNAIVSKIRFDDFLFSYANLRVRISWERHSSSQKSNEAAAKGVPTLIRTFCVHACVNAGQPWEDVCASWRREKEKEKCKLSEGDSGGGRRWRRRRRKKEKQEEEGDWGGKVGDLGGDAFFFSQRLPVK